MIKETRQYDIVDDRGVGSVKDTILLRVNKEDEEFLKGVFGKAGLPYHRYENGGQAVSVEEAERLLLGSAEEFDPAENMAREDLAMRKRREIANVMYNDVKDQMCDMNYLVARQDKFFDYINEHFTRSECETLKAEEFLKDREPKEKTAVLKLIGRDMFDDNNKGNQHNGPYRAVIKHELPNAVFLTAMKLKE